MNHGYSDEQLNAFIDNEMGSVEKTRLIQALRQDAHLRDRYNTLKNIGELVRHNYQSLPTTRQQSPLTTTRPWPSRAVAACALLLVGTIIGWQVHEIRQPTLIDLANLVVPHTAGRSDSEQSDSGQSGSEQVAAKHSASNDATDVKLMFQVSTDNPYRLTNFLDETERLLQSGQQLHRKLQIEIVTNGAGLSLVKHQNSPQAQRIQQLQQQYDNLIISACGLALQRLKTNTGETLELLPNTRVVPSALHQVIKRQQEGWIYVNI